MSAIGQVLKRASHHVLWLSDLQYYHVPNDNFSFHIA